MLFPAIVIVVWNLIYCSITMYNPLKRIIKLFLQNYLHDKNERLWIICVSLFYGLFPYCALLSTPSEYYLPFFESKNIALLSAASLLGFFGSLTISSIIFELASSLTGITYADMDNVPWLKQVKKVSPLFGVLAAVTEEFCLRFLLPCIALAWTGSYLVFIVGLILTSAVFTILQMAYAKNALQRFVKITASLSISIISLALIVATDSIIPSIVTHSLYVIFFISVPKKQKKEVSHDFC